MFHKAKKVFNLKGYPFLEIRSLIPGGGRAGHSQIDVSLSPPLSKINK